MIIRYRDGFNAGLPAGFDGEFVWDFLKPAWHQAVAEKQIEPMDFDGVVERRGKFLLFETKDPGIEMPMGQQITLKAVVMSAEPGTWHIVLCAKKAKDIDKWIVWRRDRSGFSYKYYEGDAYDLYVFCRKWFCWAAGKDVAVLTREEFDGGETPSDLLDLKRKAVAAYNANPGDATWRAAAEATKAANGGEWP